MILLFKPVTRGDKGGGLPYPFSKIGKKCPIWRKNDAVAVLK